MCGKRMEYIIIGTDHGRQRSDFYDTGLRDKLQEYIRTKNVVLIAEEVQTSEHVQTFGQDLVGDDKWLSIDMDDNERKKAGIYDELFNRNAVYYDPETGEFSRINRYYKRADGIRETFWIDRIEAWCKERHVTGGTVIITCGHNHRTYLAEKLTFRNPMNNVVIDEYVSDNMEASQGPFTELD
jgi:hypothetical protein